MSKLIPTPGYNLNSSEHVAMVAAFSARFARIFIASRVSRKSN